MKLRLTILLVLLTAASLTLTARDFAHPGLSYTEGDISRMREMISAGQVPHAKTFEALKSSPYSAVTGKEFAAISSIPEGRFNNTVGVDGRCIHDLALLYRLTDDSRYADEAVRRLNRYNKLTNCCARGTAPLDNGKVYLMLEGAELLRDYPGWAEADRRAFADMLVHPGYSDTAFPASHRDGYNDAANDVTFYWNIYNFDTGRWGNQGLCAARALMAMGIFLDNEKMYDRALRYLRGLEARADDLPYSNFWPERKDLRSESEYLRDYNVSWREGESQFISDEALANYIYRNGQCQEACRDQGHTMFGLGLYCDLAEMAHNQGDDLYGDLGHRILDGLEYACRYNLSPMTGDAWMPSGYSDKEADCTLVNGIFYLADSRSQRWSALRPTPDRDNAFSCVRYLSQAIAHYGARKDLDPGRVHWLRLAAEHIIGDGIEDWGAPGHHYEWKGWGTLTKLVPAGNEASVIVTPRETVRARYYGLDGIEQNPDKLGHGLYIVRDADRSHLVFINK